MDYHLQFENCWSRGYSEGLLGRWRAWLSSETISWWEKYWFWIQDLSIKALSSLLISIITIWSLSKLFKPWFSYQYNDYNDLISVHLLWWLSITQCLLVSGLLQILSMWKLIVVEDGDDYMKIHCNVLLDPYPSQALKI